MQEEKRVSRAGIEVATRITSTGVVASAVNPEKPSGIVSCKITLHSVLECLNIGVSCDQVPDVTVSCPLGRDIFGHISNEATRIIS
jgi:hypothetical protein